MIDDKEGGDVARKRKDLEYAFVDGEKTWSM